MPEILGFSPGGARRAPGRMRYLAWRLVGCLVITCLVIIVATCLSSPARAGETQDPKPRSRETSTFPANLEHLASPEGLTSTIQIVLVVTVMSLVPAVLLMTTSFIRIAVVLGLLRQALGTQQLPSNQVLTSIALFVTLLIMTPVWTQVYEEGIKPYQNHEIDIETAWDASIKPVRRFMSEQIERTGNSDDVWLFVAHLPQSQSPESYDDVPLQALLPAFVLSELKTAFLIGFQVYLPFLILDMVVSSVLISMGMLMVPPMLVSLPFKLLLFVLADGWHLVVGMLLESFQPFT